jgi:hypothetical protein
LACVHRFVNLAEPLVPQKLTDILGLHSLMNALSMHCLTTNIGRIHTSQSAGSEQYVGTFLAMGYGHIVPWEWHTTWLATCIMLITMSLISFVWSFRESLKKQF